MNKTLRKLLPALLLPLSVACTKSAPGSDADCQVSPGVASVSLQLVGNDSSVA